MRSVLFFFYFIIGFQFSYSSDEICASEPIGEGKKFILEQMPSFLSFKKEFLSKPLASRSLNNKKNSVPIRVHIVRDNSGFTSLDTANLAKGLRFLNEKFEGAGLEFYLCGSYDYINNTTFYNLDQSEYEVLNQLYGQSDIINLYMVNSIVHNGSSPLGVAPTPGGSTWLMIKNSADTTVYPHEMGHFFGLLHTHGYSNTVITDEFVDGSNCSESGDYFCDTPADPQLSPTLGTGVNVNSLCQYIGNLKDGHNQVYVPDATNIMSYAPHKCLSHFSFEQQLFMHWVYINRLSFLKCNSLDVNFNSSTFVSCDTPFVFTFANQSIGVSNFQWDVNDDNVTDYNTTNCVSSYTTFGKKWVSLTATNGGKTFMRYKPIEMLSAHIVPHLTDFNMNTLDDNWIFYNPDNARKFELAQVTNSDGMNSYAVRFRNYGYIGYEEQDAIVTNSYDLRNFKNARLSFEIAYAPHVVTDTFLIYLSIDCGVTYPHQILKLYGPSLQTHERQYQEFKPSSTDWKNIIVSLDSFVGNFLRFKIVNYNRGGNNVYIDNISIEGGDSINNEIGFAKTSFKLTENSNSGYSDCRGYNIISIPVFISKIPNAAVTAAVTVSGDATPFYDFVLLDSQLVFPAGTDSNQHVHVKIMDDGASEPIETLSISLSNVSTNTFSTTNRNRNISILIHDDDVYNPEDKIVSKIILEEDFNNLLTPLPSGWSGNLSGSWYSSSELGFWFYDYNLLTDNNSLDSSDYMFFWGDAGSTHPPLSDFIETETYDLTEFDSLTIELDHWLKSLLPNTGDIVIELWNGSNWINVYTHPSLMGNIGKAFQPEHLMISATGFHNADFKLRIGLVNEISSYWYALDNLKIIGYRRTMHIASKLGSQNSSFLGPNQLVHFYDDLSGEILATIQNLSSMDYGCTSVLIDREGTSAIPYTEIDSTYYATQKTIQIHPGVNSLTGTYNVTMYFDSAEIKGWETRTNNLASEFSIVKTGGAISNVTPLNINANGQTNFTATNVTYQPFVSSSLAVKGNFTQGFSGFAAAKPNIILLPISQLNSIKGTYLPGEGNLISWSTVQEIENDFFELQRSSNGVDFETIKVLKGHGNTSEKFEYEYVDKNYSLGINYYRFKQVDYSKKYFYSAIAAVNNSAKESSDYVKLFPNPVVDILYYSKQEGCNLVCVVSELGVEVVDLRTSTNQSTNQIDVKSLSGGVYFIKLEMNNQYYYSRFIKI